MSGKNGIPVPVPGEAVQLKNFRVETVRQVICTGEDFLWQKISRPLVPLVGDWQQIAGKSFSGEISYIYDFELENIGPLLLRLGKVHYAAEVFLNGKLAGQKLFPPFDFYLKKYLKRGRNHLEIKVSNTLANLLSSEEIRTLWQERGVLLSPYEKRQQDHEKESCVSGLPEKARLFKTLQLTGA